MDSTMFDFNPMANTPLMEDTCDYILELTDGGGDGWLGAYVVINQLGNSYGPYTNISSFVETINLELKSNHPVTIRAYSQTSSDATIDQIGFRLINPEGVVISSGGTNPWSDRIMLFPDKYIALPNCPTICTPYVYGCMDVTAYNYDITANTSDGSCYYSPGCTDPQFLEYYTQNFIADYNNGDCQIEAIWGCTDSTAFNYDSLANLDNGGCVPVIYGCMQPLAFNYNSSANIDDGSCVPYIYGCTDPTMFNFDANANTDDGSCIPYVFGCTDSTMFNFNPLANADNNSCIPYIYGCPDPSMLNYNSEANTEDFSCIAYIYGCMDSTALNYDPLANTENGSCIEIVQGCMDINAWNYNPEANINHGHDSLGCLYAAEWCINGSGNPFFLNDECYAWVIEVAEYCCENEWDTICQATYEYCAGTWSGPIQNRYEQKKLVAVTDLLGRPVNNVQNKIVIFIYSDGTTEKKLMKKWQYLQQ